MTNFDNISALGENSTVIVDLSRSGNNLTCTSCPTITTGKFGKAYDYAGTSFINTSPVNLGFTGSFTVGFWVNPDVSSWIDILGKKNNNGWWITQNGATFEFYYSNGGNFLTVSASGTAQVGVWTHVTAVHDAINNIDYIYIDGVESKNNTGRTTDPASDGGFRVGGTDSYPTDWDGQIDEIRIWNRSLTANEVYQIYTSNLNKYDADNRNCAI